MEEYEKQYYKGYNNENLLSFWNKFMTNLVENLSANVHTIKVTFEDFMYYIII